MSVQTAMRPSALPLPKTISAHSLSSANYDRKCMVPVLDRNRDRRAGSTPTRSIPTPVITRTSSVRKVNTNEAVNPTCTAGKSEAVATASAASPKIKANKVQRSSSRSSRGGSKENNNKENKAKADQQPLKVKSARLNNNVTVTNNNTTKSKDFVKNNAAAVSRKNSTTSRKSSTAVASSSRNGLTAAGSSSSISATASAAAKKEVQQPNYLRAASHHHQPDLVKVSSPKVTAANGSELTRLENLVDQKIRENGELRNRLGHNAKGFDALAVTVNHFAKKLDDSLVLHDKINDLHDQVQTKEQNIEQLRASLATQSEEQKYKEESEALAEAIEERLKVVHDEHEAFIAKLRQDHKTELELQIDTHRIEENNDHQSLMADRDARHGEILQEIEDKWRQKLALQLEEKSEEMRKINLDLERQEETWADTRRALEEQLHSVQNELRDQEMAVSAKQKGDLIMKSTMNKVSKVMAEADSLKAVLDMKNEEIHALRKEKAMLEDKLEDYDRLRIAYGKINAHMEDLKAQLNEKQVAERKLSEENRQLYTSVEREVNAKRRLTMQKEELEWKMKSFSSDGPMSVSMMEGHTGSPFDSLSSSSTPMMSLQPTHHGMMTMSYSDGCPQSLPAFSGRTRRNRPVSAPPCKFDVTLLAKDQEGPDSPRVLEVVEKIESVAWKLEYKEDQDSAPESNASPGSVRRKTTPPAMMARSFEHRSGKDLSSTPIMARSCTASLSRSNSVRKKIIPSFETLSESTESDSLEEPLQHQDNLQIKKPEAVQEEIIKPTPVSVPIDDILDDDIGDISSSSEIEIDEPLAEVTTPQIEALMFPTAAMMSSSGHNSSSEANLSSPDGEVTIRADFSKTSDNNNKVLTASLQTYDLNKLFGSVQDSGGEGMMAVMPEDEMSLMLTSEMSDDTTASKSKQGSEMVDSLSTVSWSEEFSSSS